MQNDNDLMMRLAKLRDSIKKKESEVDNIRKLGMLKAGVNRDYVHNLRAELLSCQREYNFILDQNPALAAGGKIIIDTFKDHWLGKSEYRILEPVEVNIEKRLQESDWLQQNTKIGEDAQYEIYFISGSFLRRNKADSSVVYLGEGSDIAAIFNGWIYWFEFGSILSDKYIYRRSIDGLLFEKLDWLSNEKTTEILGESAHCLSEDSVRKMTADSNTLIIEVFRKTRNETYSITVTVDDGELNVNRTYPWVTAPEKEAANVRNCSSAASETASCKTKSVLINNPFFVLEVLPTDKRHTIISQAEEKAFFSDGNECEEAQAKLLNPEKRLAAELDWFFGLPAEKIAGIHNCIRDSKEIVVDGLVGITRLNAVLFNFSLSTYDDYFELGYTILEIDELYSKIEITELLTTINSSRQKSGLREVSETELEGEFHKKRDQIRQLVTEKTDCLSEDDYIDFITMLAEKCIADEDFNDGIVISDVVDQYEIKMQCFIDEAADEICSHIEKIKELSNNEAIDTNLNDLIRQTEEWDRLVQPLQLRSMANGITHSGSAEIGFEIHELSVWLHNEKDLSHLALRLIDAMKPIFTEMRELSEIFEADSKTLSTIIENNKEAEQLVAEIDSLKAIASTIKVYAYSSKVDEFISKVKNLNKKTKQLTLDRELVEQLRENICYIARDVVITLHNDKQQTEYALRIANMLLAEFSDLSKLKPKLSQDCTKLNEQILIKQRLRNQKEARERAEISSRIGCFVWLGIILLVCLIGIGLSECGSTSSNRSNQSPPTHSYTSEAETYSVTFNKQSGSGGTSRITVEKGKSMPSATAPTRSGYVFKGYYSEPNGSGTRYYNAHMASTHNWDKSSGGTLYAYWEKQEDSKFTSASSVGENVYIDIQSIFPEIGIYTEGSSFYTEFVCRCVTSSGSTVWVHMSCSEYQRYFDSDASTSIFNMYAEEITFSSSKRIRGVVEESDSVLFGLSSDTGSTLLISFDSVS